MNKLNQNAIKIIANYIAKEKTFSTEDGTLLRIFADAVNNIENNIPANISPRALVKESQDLMHELLLRIAKEAKDKKNHNVLLSLCQTQNTKQFFNPYLFAELENSANRFDNPEMMLALDNCQHHFADDRKLQAHLKKYLETGATLDDAQEILFNFELQPNKKGIIVAKETAANLENLGAAETAHILKAQNRHTKPQTKDIIEAKEVFASTIIDADAHLQTPAEQNRRVYGRRMNSGKATPQPTPKVNQHIANRAPRKPAAPIIDADKLQQDKFEIPQGEKSPLIVAKEDKRYTSAVRQYGTEIASKEPKPHLFTQHELFE